MSAASEAKLGAASQDFITAIPGDRDGAPLLTLEHHRMGRLRRIEMLGDAAMRTWALLESAFDEGMS